MTGTDPTPLQPARDTILVLEDDEAIRKAIIRVLERAGYTVVGAESPTQAIQLAADHEVPLRLLITDFSFHAVTGRAVADLLVRDRPGLRVLYISGHAESDVLPEDRRDAGAAFLQKPFTMDALVTRVRELLY